MSHHQPAATQTMTRKLTHTSPFKSGGGAGKFSGPFNVTAPDRSGGGDSLGPVSPYINTMETRMPYISDSMKRIDFGSVPKKGSNNGLPSPIKMGQFKRMSTAPELRAYNPTAFNHTIYNGNNTDNDNNYRTLSVSVSAPSLRPNTMSFTYLPQQYLSNNLQVAKPYELVGTGELAVNKFGTGFNRRNETIIQNESADVIRRHSADWAIQAKMINDERRDMLKTTDSKYKYDLITGTMRPYTVRNGVSEKPIGKRIHPHEGLGPEAPHRGAEYLRESRIGRFFMPQLGGHNHHYRQDVLAREGLLVEKKSSILDLSKGELHSYGVEDQFCKSDYAAKSDVASRGLADVKVIGLFSPRMQPLNPSGDKELKQTWTKGIDLNITSSLIKKASQPTFQPYVRDPPARPEIKQFHFDDNLGTLRPVL